MPMKRLPDPGSGWGMYPPEDAEAEAGQRCEWFAGCDKLATNTVNHPILGDVPVCGTCYDFAIVS